MADGRPLYFTLHKHKKDKLSLKKKASPCLAEGILNRIFFQCIELPHTNRSHGEQKIHPHEVRIAHCVERWQRDMKRNTNYLAIYSEITTGEGVWIVRSFGKLWEKFSATLGVDIQGVCSHRHLETFILSVHVCVCSCLVLHLYICVICTLYKIIVGKHPRYAYKILWSPTVPWDRMDTTSTECLNLLSTLF